MVYPMETITTAGPKVKPTVQKFFDLESTVDDLPTIDEVNPGSTAYNVDTGDIYILRSDGEWVIQ